ncbi:unnamed protein product, partial [Medioppia subpectinata]
MAEVGRLETPKLEGKYSTGQLLLHRVFGYRGVTLFPWMARVYDRDVSHIIGLCSPLKPEPQWPSLLPVVLIPSRRTTTTTTTASTAAADEASSAGYNTVGREVRGHTHTYYQVLIDTRDCPFVRTQTEAVTFLGNQENSRSLYAIPGLDYVAHEDILPYTS